jgi:hypothetical protein
MLTGNSMGHRANYAIRRDGEVELFYSHWGGLTVPNDFFWGPDHAEAFVRSHRHSDPESEWLDDVWGEGGVALDFDNRVVTLFGGEALGHPPLRATFLGLMRALWGASDWSVEWAEAGMPSIAAAVGCDPALATSEPIPPFPADLETIGQTFESEDPVAGSLITVIRNGQKAHYVSDSGVVSTLYNGPELLEALDRMPGVDRALELWHPPEYRDESWTMGDELSHSGIIDVDEKTVSFRDDFAEQSTRAFLAEKWEGFTIEQFDGPLDAHFERLGDPIPVPLMPRMPEVSDPSEVELTEEAALAEVARYLVASDRNDPSEVVRQLQEQARDEGKEIWVNPDAAASPTDIDLSAEQRQKIFGRALALMKFLPR